MSTPAHKSKTAAQIQPSLKELVTRFGSVEPEASGRVVQASQDVSLQRSVGSYVHDMSDAEKEIYQRGYNEGYRKGYAERHQLHIDSIVDQNYSGTMSGRYNKKSEDW